MKVLLDSHVVLWWLGGGRFLSRRAARVITDARALLVSPVTCWEIAWLFARGRVKLDQTPHAWARSLFDHDRVDLAPLSAGAAVEAASLGRGVFPGDPADRLLYATAQDLDVAFVTADRGIATFARDHRDVKVVW